MHLADVQKYGISSLTALKTRTYAGYFADESQKVLDTEDHEKTVVSDIDEFVDPFDSLATLMNVRAG